MIFKEWVQDKSFFGTINSIRTFPFITAFGADKMDVIYTMLYGSRFIPSNVENMSVYDVAAVVVASFGDKWEKQYKLVENELLLGVDSKTTTEESTEDDTDRNIKTTRDNKVSAFNTDDMADNDIEDENSTLSEKNKSTKINTTTTTSIKAIQDQLDLLQSDFIIDVIMKDVSRLLSLSIY